MDIMADPGSTFSIWFINKVTGFDNNKTQNAQSPYFNFEYTGEPLYEANQVVISVKDSLDINVIENELIKKYNLTLIEKFPLPSVALFVFRFKTIDPVGQMVKKIQKFPNISSVQPNFIFITMSEPKARFQKLDSLLNFGKLHQQYSGKKVKVAIIDTGVDKNHKDLKNRIKLSKNFIDKDDYTAEIQCLLRLSREYLPRRLKKMAQ